MTPSQFIKKFHPLRRKFVEEFERFSIYYAPLLPKRLVNQWLKKHDILAECIGIGGERIVFRIGEKVVKFQRINDYNQNSLEYDFWCGVRNTEYRKLFLPVLKQYHNCKYLVVPFAEKGDKKDTKNLIKELNKYTSHPRYAEGKVPLIDDIHSDNIGFYKKSPVMIDMGFCRIKS